MIIQKDDTPVLYTSSGLEVMIQSKPFVLHKWATWGTRRSMPHTLKVDSAKFQIDSKPSSWKGFLFAMMRRPPKTTITYTMLAAIDSHHFSMMNCTAGAESNVYSQSM